ncbi:MAG: ORF6N domain-containing protein [Candidatus Delongbacteria bacterium]|jgi:phage regulator Rha-like protein|nr:ORF6N domain-containing protein [Candidatus Delongbacteria bacterium]
MKEIQKFEGISVKEKIFTIRGLQIMLDSDLAELYGVEVKYLNRVVKRNIERFPKEFGFQLTESEFESLRCQFVTLENTRGKHRKYIPYVFTQEGVAMLSAVLRSETAIRISIIIIKTFIEMRSYSNINAEVFNRISRLEHHKIETDSKFDKVFLALENNDNIPKQGVFFQGEIFKAYKFVSDLIRSAKTSIVIIDNYIDDTVLTHLTKKRKNVKVKILTKSISKQFKLDIDKFEKEFFAIEVKEFKKSHDRFIIIDDEIVYHFGASLKDLGKKLFGFSKFEIDALKIFNLNSK